MNNQMSRMDNRFKNNVKPANISKTLKRLFRYLNNFKLSFFTAFLCIIITNVTALYSTSLVGESINIITDSGVKSVIPTLILMFFLYVISGISTWFQTLILLNISQKVVAEIRKDLFEKMQKLPLKYFDTRTNGEVMSVIVNSVDSIGNALNSSLTQVVSGVISIVITLGFMIYLSPYLTMINLITVPLLLISTSVLGKFSKRYFKHQQNNLAILNGKIEEIISGQKVVNVFVREEEEVEEFEVLNQKLKSASILAQSSSGFLGPISTFVNNLSYTGVAWVGGVLAILKGANIGSITSFLIYIKQFGRTFSDISNQSNVILNAIAGAEKVFDLIDEKEEVKDNENSIEPENFVGQVTFKNVDFSYNEEKQILKNININSSKGEMIALVGPTGAGKTTIINLITRFYDINNGEILIDGVNIQNIKRDYLRSKIGLVLQDTNLFSATIMENIRYAKLDATDEEVIKAAKLANCDEFIKTLPNGYNTFLKEDADSLSQGQKQMLSIARTILSNPSILILDEATSSVDTRTEIKIQEAMNKLMEGRTSFVIAHRLSTIRNANNILVINGGEIIESGNHEELLEKKGFYHKLYTKQFSNQNDEEN